MMETPLKLKALSPLPVPQAKAVSDFALFQNLEQEMHDIRMGLFDLIEEHNRVGAPSHRFGKLTARRMEFMSLLFDASRFATDLLPPCYRNPLLKKECLR